MIEVEAKELGLKPIEVDHSFGMKRKAGVLNEEISKIQLDAQREFTSAVRDMNILSKLDKSKSEDERTLERLEEKYNAGFGTTDPDMWDMRLEAIAMLLSPKVDKISLSSKTELKLTEKYLEFIEDLAGINTKTKREKFENKDLDTSDIAAVARRLMLAILNIKKEDAQPTAEDEKSRSVGSK